jgi:hypothetical protein
MKRLKSSFSEAALSRISPSFGLRDVMQGHAARDSTFPFILEQRYEVWMKAEHALARNGA